MHRHALLIVPALMILVDLGAHAIQFFLGPMPLFKSQRRYDAFWIAYWAIALIFLLAGAAHA